MSTTAGEKTGKCSSLVYSKGKFKVGFSGGRTACIMKGGIRSTVQSRIPLNANLFLRSFTNFFRYNLLIFSSDSSKEGSAR